MRSVLALVTLVLCAVTCAAQRDYFTPEEVEIIRDTQVVDARINVLTHIIDRRFAALKVDVNAPIFKEIGDWGSAPQGTRLELLIDVKRILQKAVDDVDELALRPNSGLIEDPLTQKKTKSYAEVFPKAVRNLAAAAQRYQPALKAELDKSTDPMEKGAILDSLDLCDEIIVSVAKLPAAPPEPKKTKN